MSALQRARKALSRSKAPSNSHTQPPDNVSSARRTNHRLIGRGLEVYLLLVIGEHKCHKSRLIEQFIRGNIAEEYDPTLEDNYRKQCVVDGVTVLVETLGIVDGPMYSAMRAHCLQAAEGIMLVFSFTSRSSFEDVKNLQQEILSLKSLVYFPILVVGLYDPPVAERMVTRDEGWNLAREFGCPFREVVLTDNYSVNESFYALVREVRRYDTELKSREEQAREAKTKASQTHQGNVIDFFRRGSRS